MLKPNDLISVKVKRSVHQEGLKNIYVSNSGPAENKNYIGKNTGIKLLLLLSYHHILPPVYRNLPVVISHSILDFVISNNN